MCTNSQKTVASKYSSVFNQCRQDQPQQHPHVTRQHQDHASLGLEILQVRPPGHTEIWACLYTAVCLALYHLDCAAHQFAPVNIKNVQEEMCTTLLSMYFPNVCLWFSLFHLCLCSWITNKLQLYLCSLGTVCRGTYYASPYFVKYF